MTSTKYYPIDESTARLAHEMMSFRDYPANSTTNDYRAKVDSAAALADKKKQEVSPYYHDKLDYLLDKYAHKLADWTNAYNRNCASCPSVLISGPANFPTRKKERQCARDDTLRAEYKEIEKILEQIKTIGTGPVDLADPHAREILTDRLHELENELDSMKAANAYYRKHKTLDGCPGIDDKTREWLTRPGMFNCGEHGTPLEMCKTPYPSYTLQGVRGKIKRTKERLEELDARQAAPDQADEQHDGFRIVRNTELDRLQIVFDDVPPADVREALKGEAFHWSPKNKAWQRQLTPNAERAAKRALKLA